MNNKPWSSAPKMIRGVRVGMLLKGVQFQFSDIDNLPTHLNTQTKYKLVNHRGDYCTIQEVDTGKVHCVATFARIRWAETKESV